MNKSGIEDMGAVPGGKPEQPQATAPVDAPLGELVDGDVWPRTVLPREWHSIMTIVDILTTHREGRVATHLYEVSRDDVGCIHIIIGRPQGS